MKRLTLAAILALVTASSAMADFDRGMSAYRTGDYDRAWKEFHVDAIEGHATAQFNIGVMYYRGEGVERDLVQAYAWIELATQQRNDAELIEAQEALSVMLTPDQISEGMVVAGRIARNHDLFFRAPRENETSRIASY
jgi:TPR repeat protein